MMVMIHLCEPIVGVVLGVGKREAGGCEMDQRGLKCPGESLSSLDFHSENIWRKEAHRIQVMDEKLSTFLYMRVGKLQVMERSCMRHQYDMRYQTSPRSRHPEDRTFIVL